MPWSTPTLRDVRSAVRDAITGRLPGADASVPNSVLRVLSDAMGALCHLCLQYIDWLALQLLPDAAETEWLDRHGQIWLTNADGSTGRKLATFATGAADFVSTAGASVTVPAGTQLNYGPTGFGYETTAEIGTDPGGSPTPAPIQALDPGSLGNLPEGTPLNLITPILNIGAVTVDTLDGGTDDETDDELRARILERIRQPPMGGSSEDYVRWALSYPGVTRAWCTTEMGVGTVTVRFMMDDLRADNNGFPLPNDVDAVEAYLNTVRPVAVEDLFVEAPIPYPVNLQISNLTSDDAATRAAITTSLLEVFKERQAPGAMWYRAWSDEGIAAAPGVDSYDLDATDVLMPDPGHMPVLGDIQYVL